MTSEVYKPTDEELALLKRWYAPDVTESVDQERTNAFRMNVSTLGQQPVVQEQMIDEEQSPVLSAQALEEITAQAQEQGYQDGLSKGKEEGLLKGHEAGYQQGLEQGIENGMSQGIEQSQPVIEQRLLLIDSLISKLQTPLSQQDEKIEQALLELALTLARKVIHSEVKQDDQPIINAVSEGVRIIGHTEPLTIRINPQDIDAINSLYSKEQCVDKKITIDADASLAIGDCVLDTHSSSVSLMLEERINQVFDDFTAQPPPQPEYLDEVSSSLDEHQILKQSTSPIPNVASDDDNAAESNDD